VTDLRQSAMTTRSEVTGTTVACGLVVLQVNVVVEFVHVYQLAPSWTRIVEPATGAVSTVKETESMLPGFVALSV
jgi:hypothetical protein